MVDLASDVDSWLAQQRAPAAPPPAAGSSLASDVDQWLRDQGKPLEDPEWETRGAVQINRKTGAKRPTPQFQGAAPGLGKIEDPYADKPLAGLGQLAARTKENILNVPEFAADLVQKFLPTGVNPAPGADVYGDGVVRDMRESVRGEYQRKKDELAQHFAARGVSPIGSAAADTSLEAGGVVAAGELTNLGSAARGAMRASRAAESGLAERAVPLVDRRVDAVTRKKIAEMTPEEMRVALKTDELTGLGNRRALDEHPLAQGHQAVIDADGLKYVNDTYGHPTGSRVIEEIGGAIKAETPHGFRTGGDEFTILGSSPEEINATLERVNQRLSNTKLRYTAPDGVVHELPVGISYGAGEDVNAAEAALRAAKEERTAAGLRAERGAPPPGLRTIPPGGAPLEARASEAPQEAPGPQAPPPGSGPRPERLPEAPGLAPEPAAGGDPGGGAGRPGEIPVASTVSRETSVLEPGTTSLKNAVTDAERVARGLPEVEKLARASSGERWGEAVRKVADDPEYPRYLAASIVEKPRPMTALENDALLHDRMKITLDHREALAEEQAALASGDEAAISQARLRRVSLEAAMDINDRAAKHGGSETGAALQARQRLIREDYSPAPLVQRARVANLGRELPPDVHQKLTDLSSKIDEAIRRAETAESRVSELEAKKVVRSVQRDVERQIRKTGRAANKAELDSEFESLRRMFASKTGATPRMGLDPDLAAIIAKMAKNRVKAGVNGLGELVDGIYQVVRHHVEGLEPRDVRDAISGYGVTRGHMAQSEAVKELAQLRQEARLVSRLEDIEAGKITKKVRGAPRQEPPQISALRKKIKEASDRMGLTGEMSGEARLSALKKRLATRKTELEQQISSGLIVKKTRRPLALDPEALRAQTEVNRLKRQADMVVRKLELQNRTGLEKGLDTATAWSRAVKLSGLATLEKIGMAAGYRTLIFQPVEELIGAGLSKTPGLRGVAARAPIEGGGSYKAIAKSFSQFFARDTMDEVIGHLKMKEGRLDLAYGKKRADIPSWMEYPGHVHAAVKTMPKEAGFAYAMQKQAEHYLKIGKGEALGDPVALAEMKARAYEFANRQIFMQEGWLTNKMQSLGHRNKGAGAGEAIAAAAYKFNFPIVRVPVNYVAESVDYALGIPKGGAKLLGAITHGLEKLPAKEADEIMRLFKKGSLGGALIALGATGIVKAGGFWHSGEKRKKEDLQQGEISIAGYHIPHLLLHHPAISGALQVGAELYRTRQEYGSKEGSIGEGLRRSAYGNLQSVPFLETPARAMQYLKEEGGPTKFAGELLRGGTIPPDLQQGARIGDQGSAHTYGEKALQLLRLKHVDAKKRKPKTLLQEEEMGVPWLRERVPEK